MKAIIQVALYKFKSLLNPKHSFSAIVTDSKIDGSASVRQHARIYGSSLGRYTYVCRNTLIQHADIGAFCSISENCSIGMPSHPTDHISSSPVFLEGGNYLKKNFLELPYDPYKKTVIGNDVWIGDSVKIKGGVKIGDGAVIGAGAVVTHDIPPYAIAAGVPAKIIKYRFDKEKIDRLLQSEWWTWSDEKIEASAEFFREGGK